MPSQYDHIADLYQRSKETPLRRYVEAWSFFKLIGDVSGKSVLDLGCGEGFYTRELKRRGAARVLGVDISATMIEMAKQQENEHALGIEYVCSDVKEMPDPGEFDLVVAAYLLHYSESVADLLTMCQQIRRSLARGGRFIALNENPDQLPEHYSGYEQYGFGKSAELPHQDGAAINYWIVAGREVFRFSVCHFDRVTYQRALGLAGFDEIVWQPLSLDPRGVEKHGEEYWQKYLNNPPVTGLTSRAC